MDLAIKDLITFPRQDLISMANYYKLPLESTKNQLARSIAAKLYAAEVRSHKIGYMPNDDLGENLIQAAKSGNLELVEKLLQEGADIDYQDQIDWTALMYAVIDTNNDDMAKLLLGKGANVNITDSEGISVLAITILDDKFDFAQLLIDNNANLDSQDVGGATPLMDAVERNKVNFVELLLEKGAKVDLQDEWGFTALMYAAKYNRPDIAKLLLEKNARVDLQARYGFNALDLAKKYHSTSVVQLLQPLQPKLPFNPQWYQSCSDDRDIITQETWLDLAKEQEPYDPVTIRFPVDPGKPERVECGARENFIQMWKTAPTMVPWIANPSSAESRLLSGEPLVDDSGHGAIPIPGPKFWKITLYHYIMNPELLKERDSNYIAEKLVDEKIRYGNEKGTFGESEAHGQHSTYIYKLKVVE